MCGLLSIVKRRYTKRHEEEELAQRCRVYECAVSSLSKRLNRECMKKKFEALNVRCSPRSNLIIARRLQDNKEISLKKVRIGSHEDMIMVANEVNLLGLCDHENIARLLGVHASYSSKSEETTMYIEMEKISASLKDILEVRSLSESEISQITRQVLSGLNYLHQLGVCHMEVTSENIALNKEMTVMLTNFEKSRKSSPDGSQITQDSFWTAPEGTTSTKTDIWQLGMLLLEICHSGEPVCWNVDSRNIYKTFRKGKIPRMKFLKAKYTPHLVDFLQCCLTFDEKSRWTADKLLQHPFITTFKNACQLTLIDDYATLDQASSCANKELRLSL